MLEGKAVPVGASRKAEDALLRLHTALTRADAALDNGLLLHSAPLVEVLAGAAVEMLETPLEAQTADDWQRAAQELSRAGEEPRGGGELEREREQRRKKSQRLHVTMKTSTE